MSVRTLTNWACIALCSPAWSNPLVSKRWTSLSSRSVSCFPTRICGNPSSMVGMDTLLQSFLPSTGLPLLSLQARRPCYGHDPTQRSAPPTNRLSRTLMYNSHQTVLSTLLTCDSAVPELLVVVLLVHGRERVDSRLISKAGAAGMMWVSEWLDCS